MLPELFDHAQAENVGYLCVHRETGGQDVSILTQRKKVHNKKNKKKNENYEIDFNTKYINMYKWHSDCCL